MTTATPPSVYASPMIRGMFGTSDAFMDMVRQGYQPVYRPQAFDFSRDRDPGRPANAEGPCGGPDGRPVTAFYPMTQLPDGTLAHQRLLFEGAGRTPGLSLSLGRFRMSSVSPRVLALLGALMLVWGTNWPLFAIALREMPVRDLPHLVLIYRDPHAVPRDSAVARRVVRGPEGTGGRTSPGLDDEHHIWNIATSLAVLLHPVRPRLGAGLHHAAVGRADRLRRVRPAA